MKCSLHPLYFPVTVSRRTGCPQISQETFPAITGIWVKLFTDDAYLCDCPCIPCARHSDGIYSRPQPSAHRRRDTILCIVSWSSCLYFCYVMISAIPDVVTETFPLTTGIWVRLFTGWIGRCPTHVTAEWFRIPDCRILRSVRIWRPRRRYIPHPCRASDAYTYLVFVPCDGRITRTKGHA